MLGIPACVKRSALFLLCLLTVPIGCKPSEFLSGPVGPEGIGERQVFSAQRREKRTVPRQRRTRDEILFRRNGGPVPLEEPWHQTCIKNGIRENLRGVHPCISISIPVTPWQNEWHCTSSSFWPGPLKCSVDSSGNAQRKYTISTSAVWIFRRQGRWTGSSGLTPSGLCEDPAFTNHPVYSSTSV